MPIEKATTEQILYSTSVMKEEIQKCYSKKIHPTSALGKCIAATESIYKAEKNKNLFITDTSIDLFDKLHLCRAVSEAFSIFKGDSEFIKKFWFLFKDELTVNIKEHSRSRDTFFEFVVALMLNKVGFKIEFAEPDILVEAPNSGMRKFAVACKVVESKANVNVQLSGAKKQIQRANDKGIIALDVTNSYENNDLRKRTFNDVKVIKDHIQWELRNFVKDRNTVFTKYSNPHSKILSILLFGLYSTWIGEDQSPHAVFGVQTNMLLCRSEHSPYMIGLRNNLKDF